MKIYSVFADSFEVNAYYLTYSEAVKMKDDLKNGVPDPDLGVEDWDFSECDIQIVKMKDCEDE
jgi:hypothetical protein